MAKLAALGLLCAFGALATGCSTFKAFQVRPWGAKHSPAAT
jgi:hypothetical protein